MSRIIIQPEKDGLKLFKTTFNSKILTDWGPVWTSRSATEFAQRQIFGLLEPDGHRLALIQSPGQQKGCHKNRSRPKDASMNLASTVDSDHDTSKRKRLRDLKSSRIDRNQIKTKTSCIRRTNFNLSDNQYAFAANTSFRFTYSNRSNRCQVDSHASKSRFYKNK